MMHDEGQKGGFGRASLALTTGSYLLLMLWTGQSWNVIWTGLLAIGLGDGISDAFGVFHEHVGMLEEGEDMFPAWEAALQVFLWKAMGTLFLAVTVFLVQRLLLQKTKHVVLRTYGPMALLYVMVLWLLAGLPYPVYSVLGGTFILGCMVAIQKAFESA